MSSFVFRVLGTCVIGCAVAQGGQMPLLGSPCGSAPNGTFGRSVAALGDVDADGFDDFIVGAPNDGATGRVFVYSGVDFALLYSQPGPAGAADYGWSVSGLGDVNGDGRGDYVVGDLAYFGAGAASGAAWVCSGANGATLFSVFGTFSGGNLGQSVSSVPDLDGDSVADVLIGEPNRPGNGAVHAYSGATGGLLFIMVPSQIAGLTHAFAHLGHAVRGVGDVTGDGKSELLVGDPDAVAGGVKTGGAALIRINGGPSSYTALTCVNGGLSGSRIGAAISSGGVVFGQPGDFDDDGVPDFVVAAPGLSSGAGQVQAFSGATYSSLFTWDGVTALGVGVPPSTVYGEAVAGAGDVDGDSIADLIIGAPYAPQLGSPTGIAHVVLGKSGGGSSSYCVIDGQLRNEQFGLAVSSAGDVNKDGRSDVLVGAPNRNSAIGCVDVFSGCMSPSVVYGQGCAGSNGSTPRLRYFGCVQAMNPATLSIEGGLPNSTAVLLLGLTQASVPMGGGCSLLVSPLLPITLSLSLDATGAVAVPVSYPNLPTPIPLTLQAFVADPANPTGFSNSNGVQL
ncbi:MAG: FG-GAP repeat protein [Planctomycetes bacterium]|nr:FG-GAP repeat protein [Planctomycetota bacterium]